MDLSLNEMGFNSGGPRFEPCTMYRGHLRLALLRCLKGSDMHGLEMINRIKEITKGEWVPSPGSVYPVLQEFESYGFVTKKQNGRMITYSLTPDGIEAFNDLYDELIKQMEFIQWIIDR